MTANRMFSIITFGLSKYSIKLGLNRLSGTFNSKPVMIITVYNYWKAEDIFFTSIHMILSHDCNTLKTSELRLFHLQIYSWGLSQHLPAYPRFGPKLSNNRHCAPPSARVKIQHTAPCMRRISVVWKQFSTPAIVSKGVSQKCLVIHTMIAFPMNGTFLCNSVFINPGCKLCANRQIQYSNSKEVTYDTQNPFISNPFRKFGSKPTASNFALHIIIHPSQYFRSSIFLKGHPLGWAGTLSSWAVHPGNYENNAHTERRCGRCSSNKHRFEEEGE